MYRTERGVSGYTSLVLVNGRQYQTDHTYESKGLAQENVAMRAFMVWSANGGIISRYSAEGLSVDDDRLSIITSDSGATERTLRTLHSTEAVSRGPTPRLNRLSFCGKRVGLIVRFDGNFVLAMADTGSDGNCISEDFAKQIGLEVQIENCDRMFQLADGREIRSIGTSSTRCSLYKESWLDDANKFSISFHVFKTLAVPIIIGKKMLQTTNIMTKNTERLLVYDNDEPKLSIRHVLHMNCPQQRLRCYLDTDLVYANADTGSELNLISLEFARKRGLKIEQLVPGQGEMVMLADGNTAELSGLFHTHFYPFENQFKSHLRPPEEVFYVLEGLTTDVLIGAELLFEISAFTEQQSAFVDLDCLGINSNINTITWLSRRGRMLAGASNRGPSNTSPPTATALEVAFQMELHDDDTREQHLQQVNNLGISRLHEPESSARQAFENERHRLYIENRTRRILEHDRRMAAMAQQMRNGS